VNDNGDDSHAPKVIRWLLPMSKAAMAEATMKLRIREKVCQAAYNEMMLSKAGSWRFALVGDRQRRRFAAAFVDTMEAGGDREMFREKCRGYGVPLVVIVLLLSIAWDVLWYWWTHRKKEVAE
jgi:hypothetical protein